AQQNVSSLDDGSVPLTASDITIRNNSFRGHLGLSLGTRLFENAGVSPRMLLNKRYLIENNIFQEISWKSAPTGDVLNSPSKTVAASANFLRLAYNTQVTVRNNTMLPPFDDNNYQPVINFRQNMGAIRFQENIFWQSGCTPLANCGFRIGDVGSASANVTGALHTDMETGLSSQATIADNLVVAAEPDGSVNDWDTANDPAFMTAIWDRAFYNESGRFTIYPTDNTESVRDRRDAIFTPGTWKAT